MNLSQYWKKSERTLGSLKFAVVIIMIFSMTLAFGTFMESYHGTEYANKLVYKSLPFMLLQGLMFLSILMATLQRLPLKKNLYGFYTIHSGLLILFIGSLTTYITGIDGSITLPPNTPNRFISLNEDILTIKLEDEGKEVTYELPVVAKTQKLGEKYEKIELVEYLPFAKESKNWVEKKAGTESSISATYTINNANFGQDFTLSTDSEADFQSNLTMGLLNVHFMPRALFPCFKLTGNSGHIIWNMMDNSCFTPESKNIPIKKTKQNNRFLAFKAEDGKIITFLPDLSPLPANEKLEIDQESPYRIFSRELFQGKPHLFLFGAGAAYFDKNENIWKALEIKKDSPLELPWMGFKLTLKELEENKIPKLVPEYVTPLQDNGKIVEGELKAVRVKVLDQEYWVTSNKPLGLMVEGKKTIFSLAKKSLTLPYEFTLKNFKMDTDPGTNNPASYESFVNLFTGKESKVHHIFMNNPLKYDGFTFYQASYFQNDNGNFGSILSVNYDPGRPVKYLGSILLIFGAIWHYLIRRKTKAEFFSRSVRT
ncbi:MAG: cytochrome c biogenesis protein ResB [Bacteriovoracaceae bacterium]